MSRRATTPLGRRPVLPGLRASVLSHGHSRSVLLRALPRPTRSPYPRHFAGLGSVPGNIRMPTTDFFCTTKFFEGKLRIQLKSNEGRILALSEVLKSLKKKLHRMLVWLESAWPNLVAAAIFEITELARLLFYLALFFSLWWHWILVLPPV